MSYVGAGAVLPSRLPVRELARASVGAASLAAAELLALRNGAPVPAVRVDEGAVATAFISERHLTVGGETPTSFAPLSRFWPTADGWIRTHANYPHHRTRLLHALGLTDTGNDEDLVETVAKELASRTAVEIQETVYAADGLAVAVASEPAPAGLPLTESARIGEGGPRPLGPASLPAEGVRVLDLTRTISGPVATRTLALLGADVLRVDAPGSGRTRTRTPTPVRASAPHCWTSRPPPTRGPSRNSSRRRTSSSPATAPARWTGSVSAPTRSSPGAPA